MSVVEMLTLLTEVTDSVQRAVERFEAGDGPSGMAGLDRCIDRIERTLDGWSVSEAAADGSPFDSGDMRGELEAVLEDLRAAKELLTSGSLDRQGE